MLVRTLPDPVPPARHEIAASYISRLATLHGLDISGLWLQLTEREKSGGMRRVVVPERLAALTGRSVHALAGALPELRDPQPDWTMFRHQPQAGCHRCDTKHPGGKVTRLLPHHRYVCLRHRTWIGPPDIDHPATDLTRLPAIVDAQRKHLRILHRYGWAATYDAVLTGLMFCGHIWAESRPQQFEDPVHSWHRWDDRTHVLIPHDDVEKSYSTSKLFAAVYPEAVALAPLIASPYWRRLAGDSPPERARFYAEISKRITYPYSEHGDAIAHWADADSWRPPSKPLSNYSPARSKGTVSPLHGSHVRRHESSVLWFSRIQRNQGRTLLFHNHVKPVLTREWVPEYVKHEGTIWHSARVDELMTEENARHRGRSRPKLPKQRTENEDSICTETSSPAQPNSSSRS
ncbi:hypothetical protein EST92_16075 [Streptomyces sp. TM32]|uniref:TniQ family protein n=1 Tax=Streptomyces sp. TM32 TaxID=1652669 RepID=UPI001013958E|nr:TniQ family protein [Streptomyces sp. TM32]RXS81488.1 hypothetical protein EST92_16075 [Streptomyces sp. TM32]